MQEKIISKLSNNVTRLFRKHTNSIGNLVEFVRREDKAKIPAEIFFKVLIVSVLSKVNSSLQEMCFLFKKEGISISKQGLDQRFNAQATSLMKGVFEKSKEQFKTEQSVVFELLKPFSSVYILDSSTVGLPERMKEVYRGCGGNGPEAALKIQALFDYVKGHLSDITITDGRKNDQTFKDHLNKVERGALYLQDLGYFNLKSFIAFHEGEAHFISRHFNQTALFDEFGQRVDLKRMLRKSGGFLAKKIFLGKSLLPIRIIAQPLPKTEVEKRIKNIKDNARRHGKTPKQETLEFAKWSICITNVPENMLEDKDVYLLYSLRWQIELFFKLCKQAAGIDKIRSKKTDRVLCEIYAKLVCVMMVLHLCSPVRWEGEREISFAKAYQYLRIHIIDFFKALSSSYRLRLFLKEFLNNLKDFAMKDIKRKKPATHQILMSATGQEVLV